ncbi:hypothetical protein BT96DRAFT_740388, partial [Gymnopus androsaceus JB14]
ESTIDLVFASGNTLAPLVMRCSTTFGHTSLHKMIEVELDLLMARNIPVSQLLFWETDWEEFKKKVDRELGRWNWIKEVDNTTTPMELDLLTEELMHEVSRVLNNSVEKSKPSKFSKRWWTRD